ncbi:MAG: hypothetical protein B6U94_06595 [Thermofilum sp. ex4484_79]|nr:MAG: hypothetical protein B6U94_06595 [Thermofilum sp. ex4484_79]
MKDIDSLAKLILLYAKKDVFNGIGRVFIDSLIREGYSYDDILKAIDKISYMYDVRIVGNIIKIKF